MARSQRIPAFHRPKTASGDRPRHHPATKNLAFRRTHIRPRRRKSRSPFASIDTANKRPNHHCNGKPSIRISRAILHANSAFTARKAHRRFALPSNKLGATPAKFNPSRSRSPTRMVNKYLLGLTSGCVINLDVLTAEGAEDAEKEKRREEGKRDVYKLLRIARDTVRY